MSLGKDEKKFMELRSKLFDELEEVQKQIDDLEERRDELTCILDGSYNVSRFYVAEEVENPAPGTSKEHQQAWDDANLINLVSFLKTNPGWSRAELQEGWAAPELEIADLKRLLEKGKRRGIIVNEGRGRASVWYAAKK